MTMKSKKGMNNSKTNGVKASSSANRLVKANVNKDKEPSAADRLVDDLTKKIERKPPILVRNAEFRYRNLSTTDFIQLLH